MTTQFYFHILNLYHQLLQALVWLSSFFTYSADCSILIQNGLMFHSKAKRILVLYCKQQWHSVCYVLAQYYWVSVQIGYTCVLVNKFFLRYWLALVSPKNTVFKVNLGIFFILLCEMCDANLLISFIISINQNHTIFHYFYALWPCNVILCFLHLLILLREGSTAQGCQAAAGCSLGQWL